VLGVAVVGDAGGRPLVDDVRVRSVVDVDVVADAGWPAGVVTGAVRGGRADASAGVAGAAGCTRAGRSPGAVDPAVDDPA